MGEAAYEAELLTGEPEREAEIAARDRRRQRTEVVRAVAGMVLSAPWMLPMLGIALPGWTQFTLDV